MAAGIKLLAIGTHQRPRGMEAIYSGVRLIGLASFVAAHVPVGGFASARQRVEA